MRITTQMTANNLLLNLNKTANAINKSLLQMSTGSKIQVASEDPIVAALALKYRTNVSKTEQYQDNASQADAWMNVTESSISNANEILKGIYDLCTEAASDTYNTERKTLIDQISQFKKQLVNEANSDYAGRYIFSGFKTDQRLMYTEDSDDKYNISQKLTKDNIETVKVAAAQEKKIFNGSYEDENYIRGNNAREVEEVKRIKLPYKNVTNLKFTDSNGNPIEGTYINSENTVLSGTFEAYKIGDDEIKYVSDTGEILLGKNIAQKLNDVQNFNLNYDKAGFTEGDINPQLYFDCKKYITGKTRLVNNTLITPKPNVEELTINYGNGKTATLKSGINSMLSTAKDAYKVQPNEIRYLTDTGEILFGKNVAKEINETSNINVSYKNQEEKFSFDGTKEFPNSIKVPSTDANKVKITYTDNGTKKEFSSAANAANKITIKKSTDANAKTANANGITYLSDTGEIIFGKNVLAAVTNANDLNITTSENNATRNFKVDGTEIFNNIMTIPTKDACGLKLKIDGSTYSLGSGINKVNSTDANAYTVNNNEIKYIADTGELVFGKNILANASASENIQVTTSQTKNEVAELISNKTNDEMEYEFGRDNKMSVNVNGSDIFTWELVADLDDIIISLGSVVERTEDEIKAQLKEDMGKDYDKLTEDELSKMVADIQDGEEKTCRKVLASRFSSAIGKIQDHNEHATLMRSELGSRMNRLELINERLGNDKVTYNDLMTSNESVEYEEAAMTYMLQQTIYNSALSVGSKVIQKSLVDFI